MPTLRVKVPIEIPQTSFKWFLFAHTYKQSLIFWIFFYVRSWSQPNTVIRMARSAGFGLHQCELYKRSFRQQCLHCVSRSPAAHCQRLLAAGGGNRGPGHCHGVQRTRRWQAQMRTILERRNRCRMSIRKILCQASQITRNMPRFSRYGIQHFIWMNFVFLTCQNTASYQLISKSYISTNENNIWAKKQMPNVNTENNLSGFSNHAKYAPIF